jgi:glycosyltransferase involved in cell wall biosynthesis
VTTNVPTICQVLHSLAVGGAEVLADRLARRLSGRFRFVFVCLDELGELGESLRGDGVPVHVVDRKGGLDLGCARRLWRRLREENVDLVHAHQYTPFAYTLLARAWHRRPPILFHEHGRFHPDYPRRKRILFNRIMLRKPDRVVGVGNKVRDALIANEGIPADRVEVIYNGIPLEAYGNGEGERSAVREELGLFEGDFVLAQVARLDYLKDHLTAVRAIARCAASGPRIKLLLVGEGPERAAIEKEIAALGVHSSVRLLGLRQDVPRILAAADAGLLTSISEGIPLTVIEAMAAGLPVVSTDVGGVREVVLEGSTALLAPAGDDEALANSILKLASDPGLCRTLGTRGRERAFERFSEETMHENFARLYDEMLQRKRQGATRTEPHEFETVSSNPA